MGKRPLLLPSAVIFLGAVLRFAQLDWAQYRRDDAIVLGLAQTALEAHRIPWVGMISTLGIDNGPAQVWLVMLGTLTGPSPFAAEWTVALLNVVGIAACYAFGRDAFGRRVGLIAALLLAVSSWSVLYSRRLWGNDMTAPFAALSLCSLGRVLYKGERIHQVLVFVWAALLAQVYVIGIAELPAIALGLLAAAFMRRLRLRPAVLGIGAFLALTGPYVVRTVLPELGSLHRLTGGQHAVTDATSLRYLAETVGLDAYQSYLPQVARFLDTGALPLRLVSTLAALSLAGGALLAVWTVATARRTAAGDAGQPRPGSMSLATTLWRATRPTLERRATNTKPRERGWVRSGTPPRLLLAVLLVWVLTPVLLTMRHGVSIFPHYELGTVPATFVLMAFGLDWLLVQHWVRWAGLGTAVVLVAGQLAAAAVFLADVPNYVRGTQYGVPLADVQALGTAARALVRQQGATGLVVVGHDDGSEMGQALQTWVPNVTVADDQSSLRVARAEQRLVFLTTRDDSPMVSFLRSTAPSQDMRFPGDGTVFRLFTLTSTHLRRQAALLMPATPPVTLGNDVTLQGSALPASVPAGGTLLWATRWSVTATGEQEKPVASIFVHLLTPQGAKVAAHDQAFDNHAVRWRAGDEVLSWVQVPIGKTTNGGTDVAVGGLYRIGPGGSIEPLAGPAGAQLDLGRVAVTPARPAPAASTGQP